MQDRQQKILETFSALAPKMTELEQEKLLSFGEGLAFLFRDRVAPQTEQDSAPKSGLTAQVKPERSSRAPARTRATRL